MNLQNQYAQYAFLRSSLGREWEQLTLKVWPSVRRWLAEWAEAGQVMKLVPCRVLSAVKDTLNQHAVLKPVVRGSNSLSASNVWSRNLKIPPRTSWKKERKKCYTEWRNMNMARVLWGRIPWQRRMKMYPRKGWNTLTKESNFQNVEKLELQDLDSSECTWDHSCPVCRLLLSESCSSKVNHWPRFWTGAFWEERYQSGKLHILCNSGIDSCVGWHCYTFIHTFAPAPTFSLNKWQHNNISRDAEQQKPAGRKNS